MNKAMQAALVLAVMLAAAFSVTVVADSSDAAVIEDIEKPTSPADLVEGTVICTVDGDEFTDFADAITSATGSNMPIELQTDYYCTIGTIDFTGDLEIDLNGHTLAVNLIVLSGEESITISNGSLLGKFVDDFLHSTITARGNASITLDDVDYYTEATGAIAYDNSSITVRNGTVIHAVGFGLGTNAGDPLGYDVKVTVTDSAVYADSDPTKAGTAILFNVPGLLTITDSTIHGYYQGVIVRGGNAVISGSTITNTLGERVTVDIFKSKDWEDGNAVPTSALVIGNKTASAYQYPTSVSITDTKVVTDGAKAGLASTVIINANSGDGLGVDFVYDEQSSFTNTGKTDVASDITYDTSDDNIAVGNPVAKIGDRGFASLQAAVAAVPTDGTETTIVLVDDVSLSITDGVSDGNIIIPSGDNIILDLNGHDITVESSASNDNQYVFSVEGTLTIMDDSTADVGKITSRGVNVKESGHLTLRSGTIDSIDSTGAAVRVEGKFDMTGGTLMVSKDGSDNPCLDTRDNGTSNVTGGTFDPSKWTIRNLGTLNISGVTLTSDTTNWNSIKIFTGNVTIENCTFDLSLGGGVEVTSASGYPAPEVTISNSEFTQSELSGTQSWNSMCVAVSGGSSVTVNDCTFNTVAYGFYVFSSGGSIEVNGGTYNATGDKPLFQVDADTSSYPDAVSSAVVNGGTFNGTLPTGLGERESLTIYGGKFLDKDGNPNTAATQYVAKGYTIDTGTGSVVLADDVPCVAKIGDRQFASLSDAVDAASERTGDVTITIVGEIDLSDSFEDPELSFDLSDSDITSLRIQGSGESASFTSGVDGNNIDGPTYCPAVRFTLPDGAELTIDGITFQDDLWIDNNSGPVSFTGCTFHGSISAYPQSDRVTFDDNIFDFYGTASEFYTHNAYPMWFKITDRNTGTVFDLVFTDNDVKGHRGVHIENRSDATVNIEVTGNKFTLDDTTDYNNKTIALQLVNQMNGKVVFTGNIVDAYMAVCLFKDVNFTGTIEYADNTLQNGCKAFGSSEWNSDSAEAADDFAASLLPARIGDVYYPTLQDAFDAAVDGDTINLNKSVSIDTAITLSDGRSLTLNLGNGFDIESSASTAINIEHGSLNIQGRGTISIPVTGSGAVAISGSTDPSAVDYSVLTVGEDVTLQGYFGLLVQEKIVDKNRVVGSAYGVRVEIYGTAIGLTDNITDGDWHGAALDVNGNIHGLSGNLPVINIHSSAVITGTDDALGIYGAGQAVWNVYGATIKGSTGIEIRNGTLNIESGTVTSTASDYVVKQNGSGRTTTGAAIAITPYYPAGEDTIHISIGNGTFTGPVSFSQSNVNGVTGPGYDIEIKGGIFTSTGTGADRRHSAIVTADSIGTFVSGGTFSSDVTAYCDEGFKPIYNGTSYVVQAAHTVTFDYEDGIKVVVLEGNTVDVPDLPVREGYSYSFSVNGVEWDFSTAITQDIEIDVTEYISDIAVNVTFGTDSSGNVTFTATATSSVVQDFTYVWHYEGDDDYEYEGATITNCGPGGYSVIATAVDSDGVTGNGYYVFTYRQSYSDDPSDPPVQNVDITHSGQQLDEITVNSGTIVVTSDGDHSDIDMRFDFDDGVVENAPTIEISGNVGTGVITITVTDLSSDSFAVVDRIVEDVNSSVTTDVTTEDVVSVDVSLDNVTSLERMIIKIPMGEAGKYVASGQAYYITENGSYVSVPSSIQGNEVWIYTDHNTPYVYVATSYASSMTFEDEPDLGTDEPDITPPIIIPDDDDPVIPPTIVVDESSSDDGEAVKIAACAAAAVAAAIMALILVAEYRKR